MQVCPFDHTEKAESALLVHVDFGQIRDANSATEFVELAQSAGVHIGEMLTTRRVTPDPKLFIGSGKAFEVANLCRLRGLEVVLFNHDLSPTQERNLEQVFGCRVVNRSRLILDIFAQRARSFEGKLQVELAQLRHCLLYTSDAADE